MYRSYMGDPDDGKLYLLGLDLSNIKGLFAI